MEIWKAIILIMMSIGYIYVAIKYHELNKK